MEKRSSAQMLGGLWRLQGLVSEKISSKYCTVKCENLSSMVWKNEKFTVMEKIFRQITYLVLTLFSKNVTLTEFLTLSEKPNLDQKKYLE